VDAAHRDSILARYRDHAARFDAIAGHGLWGTSGVAFPHVADTTGGLSGRELEVLELVSGGLANREIGSRLFISEETVKSHVRKLLGKLPARSRAHAVGIGFRRGLIS
jgi:DNA-binding CsgD family transcriptional regulator